MLVDVKVKIWMRHEVPKELQDKVRKAFESGEIENAIQLYDYLGEESDLLSESYLHDTEDPLEPSEEDTITVQIFEGNEMEPVVWENRFKPKKKPVDKDAEILRLRRKANRLLKKLEKTEEELRVNMH